MRAEKINNGHELGFILMVCLVIMSVLSLIALTAMKHARTVNKQVASFTLAKEAETIALGLKSVAISALEDKNNSRIKTVDLINTDDWLRVNVDSTFEAIAHIHIQHIDDYRLTAYSPKLSSNVTDDATSRAYLYRLTYKVSVNGSYERLGQFDYLKVRYE